MQQVPSKIWSISSFPLQACSILDNYINHYYQFHNDKIEREI